MVVGRRHQCRPDHVVMVLLRVVTQGLSALTSQDSNVDNGGIHHFRL